jgi:RND family efflux transporter MFP subunit
MTRIEMQRRSLAAVALLAAVACSKKGTEARAEAGTGSNGVVIGRENVTIAARQRIESGPAVSGSLAPEREAQIRAQIGGTVLQTAVEAGQRVGAGALLVRLDDAAVRDQVLSARSAVASAQAGAEVASRNFQRSQTLLAAGAIAERDAESARQQNPASQAALANARAQLANAEKQLSNTVVRAPFAGIVGQRAVSAGDVVAPGGLLVTVVDPTSMRLEASVPAEQLSAIRVGAPVRFRVSGYGDRQFEGRITRVSPVADAATRQVPIIASIPNSGNALVGGLFAEGRVASDAHEGIVVPLCAVDQRGVAPQVLRLRSGRAERVTVELGLQDAAAETVEVRTGLTVGDTLLAGAAQGITPGTVVKVGDVVDRAAQPQAAAAAANTQKR